MEIILEKQDIKYRLLRVLNLIILIMLILLVLFFDIGLDKYERIFWCVPIITAVLLIVDDILKDIKNKNNIFLKIEGIIFFTQWILLSSMQIIILFLDLSIVSKMISLLCLIALNYVAYKRYMGKNEEEIERKE